MIGKIKDHAGDWTAPPILPGFCSIGIDTPILLNDIYHGPWCNEWKERIPCVIGDKSMVGRTLRAMGAGDSHGTYRPIINGWVEVSNPDEEITIANLRTWHDTTPTETKQSMVKDAEIVGGLTTLKVWTSINGSWRLWKRVAAYVRPPSVGNRRFAEPLPLP